MLILTTWVFQKSVRLFGATFLDFWLVNFGGVVGTTFKKIRGIILSKSVVLRNLKFSNNSGTQAKKWWEFWRRFPVNVVKSAFYMSGKSFEGIVSKVKWNFRVFLDTGRNIFGICAEFFGHGCLICIVSVRRMILKRTFWRDFCLLISFSILGETFFECSRNFSFGVVKITF